jgi:hypothetical protein
MTHPDVTFALYSKANKACSDAYPEWNETRKKYRSGLITDDVFLDAKAKYYKLLEIEHNLHVELQNSD